MNRSDLIQALKESVAISRRDAEVIINTFFSAITDTLVSEDRVEIRGFGSFTVKRYDAYTGRNPKTGDKISVPAKKLPFFKVGKELKEAVNNDQTGD